jgi:molecular chaperone Hsp33
VRLAVVRTGDGADAVWRAGGLILQNIAEDDARGATQDAWETAQAFFETLGEDELTDPKLSSDRLLFRLFHEDGVRLFTPQPLRAVCRCSQERIASVLGSFPLEERADMVEDDGKIRVTCEFCSRVYELEPDGLEG